MDLLISDDSGPFSHKAIPLEIATIGIYTPTDPLECGSHKDKQSVAIQKRLTCPLSLKENGIILFVCFRQGPAKYA